MGSPQCVRRSAHTRAWTAASRKDHTKRHMRRSRRRTRGSCVTRKLLTSRMASAALLRAAPAPSMAMPRRCASRRKASASCDAVARFDQTANIRCNALRRLSGLFREEDEWDSRQCPPRMTPQGLQVHDLVAAQPQRAIPSVCELQAVHKKLRVDAMRVVHEHVQRSFGDRPVAVVAREIRPNRADDAEWCDRANPKARRYSPQKCAGAARCSSLDCRATSGRATAPHTRSLEQSGRSGGAALRPQARCAAMHW